MPGTADTISAVQAIDGLLAAAIEGARQLLGVLQREQQALAGQDPASVEQVVAEKHEALARLQQLAVRRHGLAAALPDRGWLAAGEARRTELERLLIELRQQNEINGGLVQRRLQHARQALAVLRGQSGQPSLYGPRGGFECESGAGRSIVSA